MPEMNENTASRQMTIRHRGRTEQIGIYFGKMLRMFVYQNDWKVLPMAALIAGLVGMVIKSMLFMSMEGTLMGSFALVMVCIWNGCFNSIQVICRERDVIKREHRSGMHISSYVASHMMYQLLLCLLQTGVTVYITKTVGVRYPEEGLFTPWMIVDFGISMLLITYASDMLSLWISCLARTTTAAMTIMPFILIFQLIFSGGMMSLPDWSRSLSGLTISSPGFKVIMAQSDYNNQPFAMLWNQVYANWKKPVSATVTLGEVLDFLQNEKIKDVKKLREMKTEKLVELTAEQMGIPANLINYQNDTTIGELIDAIAEDPEVQANRDESYTFNSTVGEVVEMFGTEKVRNILLYETRDARLNHEYDNTKENILSYWLQLLGFTLPFAGLATVTLEFIDKDKR